MIFLVATLKLISQIIPEGAACKLLASNLKEPEERVILVISLLNWLYFISSD